MAFGKNYVELIGPPRPRRRDPRAQKRRQGREPLRRHRRGLLQQAVRRVGRSGRVAPRRHLPGGAHRSAGGTRDEGPARPRRGQAPDPHLHHRRRRGARLDRDPWSSPVTASSSSTGRTAPTATAPGSPRTAPSSRPAVPRPRPTTSTTTSRSKRTSSLPSGRRRLASAPFFLPAGESPFASFGRGGRGKRRAGQAHEEDGSMSGSIFDEGAVLVPELVTPAEERRILQRIAEAPWMTDIGRRVQHYGYRYDYRGSAPPVPAAPFPRWGRRDGRAPGAVVRRCGAGAVHRQRVRAGPRDRDAPPTTPSSAR